VSTFTERHSDLDGTPVPLASWAYRWDSLQPAINAGIDPSIFMPPAKSEAWCKHPVETLPA